jgi:uncharacterized membrane protein
MFSHAPTARSRSLVKAVSWRFVGSLDTLILSFIVPLILGVDMKRSAQVAFSIMAIETLTKIALFYMHERVWARVTWGRADKEIEAHPEDFAHH